ncbi:MAG TPA: hypothetical protein ENK09_12025 [Nitrospirae bacterium]|nr:hypothetical protein [Nitrospirota bacterium]
MCKLIRRVICLIVLITALFLVLSVLRGGEPFRWFGHKSEEVGREIREKSEKLAEEADKLKETSKTLKKGAEELKKAKEKIKDVIN